MSARSIFSSKPTHTHISWDREIEKDRGNYLRLKSKWPRSGFEASGVDIPDSIGRRRPKSKMEISSGFSAKFHNHPWNVRPPRVSAFESQRPR